jgi:hypothetical protein
VHVYVHVYVYVYVHVHVHVHVHVYVFAYAYVCVLESVYPACKHTRTYGTYGMKQKKIRLKTAYLCQGHFELFYVGTLCLEFSHGLQPNQRGVQYM